MPRFVLLHHDCPPEYRDGAHWDLMFQQGDRLATWALQELPTGWPTDSAAVCSPAVHPEEGADTRGSAPVNAKRLADHRPMYLDYEGPVSGDRGAVRRVLQGEYEPFEESELRLQVQLTGESASCDQLRGEVTLTRDDASSHEWRLTWKPSPGEA